MVPRGPWDLSEHGIGNIVGHNALLAALNQAVVSRVKFWSMNMETRH